METEEEIEIPYSKLSKWEKFDKFKYYNFCRGERHYVAVYLKALWLNDIETLNEFERFGYSIHNFILNKRTHDVMLAIGYTDINYDDANWIIEPVFEIKETISFDIKKSNRRNKIDLSQMINGKWIIGVSFSGSNGGMGSGLSIWNDPYNSRKEAITDGLNKMIKFLSDSNDSISKETIKQVTNKLNELTEQGQLTLF